MMTDAHHLRSAEILLERQNSMKAKLGGRQSSSATNPAVIQAHSVETWQDWKSYLSAHLTLLEVRMIESDPRRVSDTQFFLGVDTPESRRSKAQKDLTLIPAAKKLVFDARRDERRTIVQARLEDEQRSEGRHRVTIDADVVDQVTYSELLAQATGDAEGFGWFPDGESFLKLNVAQASAGIAPAEYNLQQTGAMDANEQRKRLLAIPLVIAAGLALMFAFWPSSTPSRASQRPLDVLVDGVKPSPWRVVEAVGIDAAGAVTTYRLADQPDATWPRLRDGEPDGRWHREAVYPVEVCLPEAATETLATLRLRGGADVPERMYTVTEEASGQPDLVIAVCGATRDTWARFGTIKGVTPLAASAMNAPVAIGNDQELTLNSVQVIGNGEDTSISIGSYRVRLRISAPKDLDWNMLGANLALLNGADVRPEVPRFDGGQTVLDYVVTAFQAPTEAAWTITPPNAAQSLRWRITLNTPPTREQVVRQFLQVSSVGVPSAQNAEATLITFTLTNTGTTPLQLEQRDITIRQNTSQIVIPTVSELNAPLAPQEQREVRIKISGLRKDIETELTVGKDRYRLNLQ